MVAETGQTHLLARSSLLKNDGEERLVTGFPTGGISVHHPRGIIRFLRFPFRSLVGKLLRATFGGEELAGVWPGKATPAGSVTGSVRHTADLGRIGPVYPGPSGDRGKWGRSERSGSAEHDGIVRAGLAFGQGWSPF
jgi:hypothetical protein